MEVKMDYLIESYYRTVIWFKRWQCNTLVCTPTEAGAQTWLHVESVNDIFSKLFQILEFP